MKLDRPEWLGRDHDVRMWIGIAAGALCIIGLSILLAYGHHVGAFA